MPTTTGPLGQGMTHEACALRARNPARSP
ncbi:hypothetical protein ACFZA1_14550 [Streptomyces filipinensis]